MGLWESMRTAVDRVTGASANITLGMEPKIVVPEQTVSVRIELKNGPAPLDVRAVLLEVEGIEHIDLPKDAPRDVDWGNLVAEVAVAATRPQTRRAAPPATQAARHTGTTFEARVAIAPGLSLAPGEERKFQGTFRLPASVQPSYQGKYARHSWRLRARLDVLGVDPDTGWLPFRVVVPR